MTIWLLIVRWTGHWTVVLTFAVDIGFLLSELSVASLSFTVPLFHCLYPVFQLSLCLPMMICSDQSCLVTVPGGGDGEGAQSCLDSRPADTAGRRAEQRRNVAGSLSHI